MHGYDNPWPGGGGENKWNPGTTKYEAWDTTNYTIDSDYIPVPAGISTIALGYAHLPSGQVQYLTFVLYDENKNIIQTINRNNTTYTVLDITGFSNVSYVIGKCRSWQMGFQYAYIAFDKTGNTFNFKPYSNMCPISGWTGANIYNEETYDASATPKLTINWQTEAGTIYGGTVTLNEDGSADVVSDTWIYTVNGDCVRATSDSYNTDVSTYVRRNGIGIRFKKEGTAVISKAFSDSLVYQQSNYGTNSRSNSWASAYNSYTDIGIRLDNSLADILATDSYEERVVKVNAYLAEHPVTVGGELETPVHYHIDNIGQLYTILGTNNVWADTGVVTINYIANATKFSFNSPLHTYNFVNLKLFGNTYIEHGKG